MTAKVMFVAALMLVLAACSNTTTPNQPSSATTPTAQSTTSAPDGTTTTADAGPTAQALSPIGTIAPQPLTSGDYTTTVMTPKITFTASPSWDFLGEFPPLLLLGQAGFQELNFVRFPSSSVDTVANAIKNETIFNAEVSSPATVGRIDGISFMVSVVVPGGGSGETTVFPNNQIFSQVDLDPPRFINGRQIRFTLIPIDSDVLAIMAIFPGNSGLEGFLDIADELLATVVFGDMSTQ